MRVSGLVAASALHWSATAVAFFLVAKLRMPFGIWSFHGVFAMKAGTSFHTENSSCVMSFSLVDSGIAHVVVDLGEGTDGLTKSTLRLLELGPVGGEGTKLVVHLIQLGVDGVQNVDENSKSKAHVVFLSTTLLIYQIRPKMSIGTSILFVDGPFSRLVRVFGLRITENEVDPLGGSAGTAENVLDAFAIRLDVVAAMRFVA